MDDEDEVKELRRQLAEEKQRRQEAEDRAQEAGRRREEAERAAEAARPQKLIPYLEACHSLNLAIQVITDRSLTTQGDATNPVGRIYPKRIVPWDSFPMRQEMIWEQLAEPSFTTRRLFPSQHQLDYVRSVIGPISSEHGLRYVERDVVENAVQKLINSVYDNPILRRRLGLRGTVTFESHTNLGNNEHDLSNSLDHMSISRDGVGDTTPATTMISTPKHQRKTKGRGTGTTKGKAKGKGNRADHFCIYATSDGANIPTMAIEYKAPHKLTQDEIVTGLLSEIRPDLHVINKDSDDFTSASTALATAVITQLFSYMIGKGIQYGYVSTGQARIFLHIPDDPTMVYYYVSVPSLDVVGDDETRLHRTAVAQVFAFVLQSLRAPPPPLSWHDAAAELDTWAVEYDDVLSKIPETVRKGEMPRSSSYKPRPWRGFERSPIKTRSRCQQLELDSRPKEDDSSDEAGPSSPTPTRSTRLAGTSNLPTSSSGEKGEGGGKRERQGGTGRENLQDRPYCTHRCLLGLVNGEPLDESCPNARDHGLRHIEHEAFLRLLQRQASKDRGRDADSAFLYLFGAVGSLFKIRLSAYGYTLVAKGVKESDTAVLRHERDVYDRLRPAQGKFVPACLGMICTDRPLYHDGPRYHFLLLSWAGRSLARCADQIDKRVAVNLVKRAFTELHQLQIRHGDAEVRHILYDGERLLVVDFERADLSIHCPPLGPISPNGQDRKRKRELTQKQGDDAFTAELRSVVQRVSDCFS